MTTNVTIHAASHRVRVTTRDDYRVTKPDGDEDAHVTEVSTILRPGDVPLTVYATTTRTISIVDLENP